MTRAPLAAGLAIAAATLAGLGLGPSLGVPGPRGVSAVAGLLVGLLAVALARAALAAVAARRTRSAEDRPSLAQAGSSPPVILDTSVIIDGRVVGVCAAGFIEGRVLVPGFVLRELRQIADSPDGLRSNRARRGFEALERLRQLPRLAVETDARDFAEVRGVDGKLVALARATGGRLVTNDVALARRAAEDGVTALSVSELAEALRPVVLTGESLAVRVIREGREAGQGVGYLDDGTMVVVDRGRRLIGRTVQVTVTTVRQTSAGRMIFARPDAGEAVAR